MTALEARPDPGAKRADTGPTAWRRATQIPHLGLLIVIAAVVIFTATQSDAFLTSANMLNVARQISVVAVLAGGLTLLMTAGGMDFSMGSVAGVSTAICAQLSSHGQPLAVAVGVAVLVAIGVGLVNGLVVTIFGVAPFVVTLASATLLDGVALLIINGLSVTVGPGLNGLGYGTTLGIPNLVLIAVVVLAAIALAMRFTIFGRDAFAIGGNEDVARLSGIKVNRNKLLLYVLAGLLSAIAGVMLLSRLGASSPGTGGLMLQLTAVAAVVIGGTSLAGGHGTIVGTALGVLLIGLVANSLNLLQVSSYYQQISVGAVLLLAAISNQIQRRTRH
ncbi:MAG: ABC transporter permease [Actinomycetota bacterium]|nr:ABC transporter permease [Actinomycetota bacterium]